MLDWEVGCRGSRTLKRLWKRLQEWQIEVYCSDYWQPYAKLLPPGKLVQSKAETYTAEGIWSDLRHWLARFKRRGKVVSRSLEMLKHAVGLYFQQLNTAT